MKLHWLVALSMFALGCSNRPGAIRPAEVDAADAASTAIEENDRDGDGKLNKDEWGASAVLAASIKSYDTNTDGVLDSDELEKGLDSWRNTGVGARSVPFKIVLDGRPLAGATVRLVPAEFLGDGVKPASGESGPSGGGSLSMSPDDMPANAPKMPLVQPGLYSVEITHPTTRIPAKYNTETTLGIEITSGNPGPEGATWTLSSK